SQQQIQRVQNGQACADQRHKLLIKNHELFQPDLAPLEQGNVTAGQHAPRLDPINQVALLDVPLPDLGFREAALDLLQKVAAPVGHLDQEFRHPAYFAPEHSVFSLAS